MSKAFKVELHTRDGQQLGFDCAPDENVLAAAARQGLSLPAMCRSGSCGVCRGHCQDGAIELGPHSPEALSEADRQRGETLLCSSYPRSDLVVAVDVDLAGIQAPPPVEREATVAVVEPVGGEVVNLVLLLSPDPNGDASVSFEVGQYMELTLPDSGVTRAYSIANTPNWEGRLEFYIRLQPEGHFSHWLRQAKAGDHLKIRGPFGHFSLDESSLAPRWFVAGGTGLAPILAMLRWMGEMGAMQPTRLYLGLNRESDRFAQAELAGLQAILPGLRQVLCLWHPQEEWQGFVGNPAEALQRDLAESLAAGKSPDIYLCGPPAMVAACEAVASELGLPAAKIHSERFLPSN